MHASFSRKEIEQFIGRARSVELLQFARKESPFLPVHFRALQSLQEEEALLPQTVYLADFAPEEIKIRELDKEVQEVKQKYENSKVMEVERCKKENPNSPEVLEYQNIFQKKYLKSATTFHTYDLMLSY